MKAKFKKKYTQKQNPLKHKIETIAYSKMPVRWKISRHSNKANIYMIEFI